MKLNHDAESIFDAIGTTKDQIIDYLINLRDTDGNRPGTLKDAADLIVADIRKESPEAVGVLSQVFTNKMLESLMIKDESHVIIGIGLNAIMSTAEKPSYVLEEVVNNTDECEDLLILLLVTFLASINK